jgi:ribosomal-protein-alanine N-acetyltransferase
MPSFPELREPLSDGSVLVRPAAERDIPEVLIAYQDDPELHLRMGQGRPPSGAELGRHADRAEADRVAGRGLTLTILTPGDDTCRGQINVHHVELEHARVELGCWVAPDARGKGLARGALRLTGRWLLRECGFERVEILTETDNERMLHAARAAGFTFEGVLRGYTRERGTRSDAAALSLVRRDLAG